MSAESKTALLPKAIIAAVVGSIAGGAAGVWSLRSPATVNAAAPALIATAPSSEADTRVLERARMLARRPDVTELMALRDEVIRRAVDGGTADSPSVKTELVEIDRRLDEARALRLKLDAQEFSKTK